MPNSTHGSVATLIAVILLIILGGYGWVQMGNQRNTISPDIPGLTYASEGNAGPSVTPSPVAQNNTGDETSADLANPIDDEIREVFGKDADKAFLLLSCENSTHNPDAVNTAGNYPEGSRDIGVFQINEYWQGVNGRFLFNPSINIRIAHDIFKANGDFHLWTCGRKLGI